MIDDLYVRWGKSRDEERFSGRDSNRTQPLDNMSPSSGSKRTRGIKTKDEQDQSRAILAGCCVDLSPEKHARAMSELKGLADACGLTAVSTVIQNAAQITHATYMGSGKVQELKREIEEHDADIVIFNETLTPMQMRFYEECQINNFTD